MKYETLMFKNSKVTKRLQIVLENSKTVYYNYKQSHILSLVSLFNHIHRKPIGIFFKLSEHEKNRLNTVKTSSSVFTI